MTFGDGKHSVVLLTVILLSNILTLYARSMKFSLFGMQENLKYCTFNKKTTQGILVQETAFAGQFIHAKKSYYSHLLFWTTLLK